MPLTPGARLGPYEILALIGSGGMGEVYRARDTRLERTVAIKVLPAHFAIEPELRERLDREARTISQLSHPHICVLHDVGHQDGIDFLVMEHLEGETLETRLARGAVPCAEALRIASQIASALDKAHRAGIVHRDLKPGNIMLTSSGAKLLDFGLAKASGLVVTGASATTLSPPGLTAQGTILGTFQYMSPEQVEGLTADPRSDIFAFGSVLYEMITGRRAFEGKSPASLIGAILKDQPAPIASVQPIAPAALDHVVARCLAKDPDSRWQSAGDLASELQWIAAADPDVAHGRAREHRRSRGLLYLGASIAVLATVAALIWTAPPRHVSPPSPTARTILPLGTEFARFQEGEGLAVAISPDGRSVVYRAGADGATPSLFIRAMNDPVAVPIPGTEDGTSPFFSPDGHSLGFLAGRSIKTVTLGGGAPVTVFDDVIDARGMDWGDDGWIYFTPRPEVGIWRVRQNGGTPEKLTTPDFAKGEKTHRWPAVLPGAKGVLFVVGTSRDLSFDDARIEVLSLLTGKREVLITGGSYPRYLANGDLVYVRSGSIVAVPFDLKTMQLRGSPVTVEKGVQFHPAFGVANFATSANGTLVYLPGSGSMPGRTIALVDRQGRMTPTGAVPAPYSQLRVSPDGSRAAVSLDGATQQIDILDLTRNGNATRLTHGWDNMTPVWTPDGSRIAFASNRGSGTLNLYWQAADGGSEAERLTTSAHVQQPGSWTPDGKTLAFMDSDPASMNDIWVVNLDDRKPRPFVKTPFEDVLPAFSPDGHWLAYASNDSGRFEVYVQAFPAGGGRRWTVSIGGGGIPFWSRNGHELFYVDGAGKVMAVPVTSSPDFRAGTPTPLFGSDDPFIDVMGDGRFVMIKSETHQPPTHFNIIFNWFEELAARVPATVK